MVLIVSGYTGYPGGNFASLRNKAVYMGLKICNVLIMYCLAKKVRRILEEP
jgi:hypothetical protein